MLLLIGCNSLEKSHIWKTRNPSMCAPSPKNLKIDRNKQKQTEMDSNRQKQAIMDRYRQMGSETVRKGQKLTKTDNNHWDLHFLPPPKKNNCILIYRTLVKKSLKKTVDRQTSNLVKNMGKIELKD